MGVAQISGVVLLLAGTLRAEAVLAVANLVWVLLLGLGVGVLGFALKGLIKFFLGNVGE